MCDPISWAVAIGAAVGGVAGGISASRNGGNFFVGALIGGVAGAAGGWAGAYTGGAAGAFVGGYTGGIAGIASGATTGAIVGGAVGVGAGAYMGYAGGRFYGQQKAAESEAQRQQAEAIKKLNETTEDGTLEVNKTANSIALNDRAKRAMSSLRVPLAALNSNKTNQQAIQNVYGVDSNNVANSTKNMMGLNIAA